MTKQECIALLDRYANYDGMGIPQLAGCKEAMRKAVELLSQPSLPTDVDEAADYYEKHRNPFADTEPEECRKAFKAGAAYERGKYELVYEGNGAIPDDRGGYWPSDVKLYARKGGEE